LRGSTLEGAQDEPGAAVAQGVGASALVDFLALDALEQFVGFVLGPFTAGAGLLPFRFVASQLRQDRADLEGLALVIGRDADGEKWPS
jgi:hypothetical protein